MASSPPILSLKNVSVTFGGKPLFEDVTFNIYRGDHASLIGKNGCGKSTLLKVIAGMRECDEGEVYMQPGLKISYLPQEFEPADVSIAKEYVQLSGCQGYEADMILEALQVDPQKSLEYLSGGEQRRLSLAKALAGDHDLLLLDEPTNHLDLPTIQWLEEYLKTKTYIVISHDRAFLAEASSSMLWFNHQTIQTKDKGFGHFDAWVDETLDNEQRILDKLDAKLKLEHHWLLRGVTARRKRNQGRLEKLKILRAKRTTLLSHKSSALSLPNIEAEVGSRCIIDAKNISHSFKNKPIVKDFSTRILYGDRIGILGPNGAGKTTLIKILVGLLKPQEGEVTLGPKSDFIYFDQVRSQLKPHLTVWETLCEAGGSHVQVGDKSKHVIAYLKDFLFTEKDAHTPVSILSGGQKNRLALAKLFTKQASMAVLDEPTNDLDMDTLDFLVDLLSDYQGTLLLISHDRYFLDQLTSSIIAVEGNGHVEEYAGGYQDYLRVNKDKTVKSELVKTKNISEKKNSSLKETTPKPPSNRISFKDKHEWEQLPLRMDALQNDIDKLESSLSDSSLYTKDPKKFEKLTAELEDKRSQLIGCEERWLELADIMGA